MAELASTRKLGLAAAAASLSLLALRLSATSGLGLGDAEALYASYALFPQPVYLDHPGLVGLLMAWIGGDDAERVHRVAALLAGSVPWVGALAVRACGGGWPGALAVAVALCLVPELIVGLSAITPDLPLALAWLGTLGAAGAALQSPVGSRVGLVAWLATGAFLGLASMAKASGVLLFGALAATLAEPHARIHLRSLGPWAMLGTAAILVSPIAWWEASHGGWMLQHRLVAQVSGGPSWRALGVLAGQLLYVSPFLLWGAWLLFCDLRANRAGVLAAKKPTGGALSGKNTAHGPRPHAFGLEPRHLGSPVDSLLFNAALVPAAALIPLCLISRAAEPHWLAPVFLSPALHLGRSRISLPRWVRTGGLATGVFSMLATWLWLKTPLPIWVLGSHVNHDISSDLYAWGPGRGLVREAVRDALLETHHVPAVVGPHWIVCAQAQVALGTRVPVGCNTPRRDDFDGWYPRARWMVAPVLLYVYDTRFGAHPLTVFPERVLTHERHVEIVRSGQTVRTIHVARLELAAVRQALGAGATEPGFNRRRSSAVARSYGRDLGVQASDCQELGIGVLLGVRGRQQAFAVEDAVCSRVQAPQLALPSELFTAGRQANPRRRHEDSGQGYHPYDL